MCVDILSQSDCERSIFLHSGQAAQTNKPSSLESSFLNIIIIYLAFLKLGRQLSRALDRLEFMLKWYFETEYFVST